MYSPKSTNSSDFAVVSYKIDPDRRRYPFCIVWTPLPLITYFFPFIGHMGISTSSGVIRDFAGPFHVSEDNMAFGWPTKYWQLDSEKAKGAVSGWDTAVTESSDIYKSRMHNLFCDNCHSHVAMALNLMSYDNSDRWNMVKLAILMMVYGKYVSFLGFVKTWGPFFAIIVVVMLFYMFTYTQNMV